VVTSSRKKTSTGILCPLSEAKTVTHGRAREGKRFVKGMGYGTQARELTYARDVGFSPLKIDFDRLGDGQGIEQTLHAHHDCWHKLCRNEYFQLKLDSEKRKRTSDDRAETPVLAKLGE